MIKIDILKILLPVVFVLSVTGSINGQTTEAKLPLSGVITDAATKKAIIGITVTVENFSATITDENGKFTINVPSYDAELIISGEGYETRHVPLKGRNTVNVSLLDDDHFSFQQTVDMPFGKMLQRKTTAAVGTYNANGEWKRPDETIDALLQGQAAGLNSIRRSGSPGVGANLFLRGYNSLYATNKPLFIVDGMLYDVNDYGESIIANNYTNPLALINAQDIDNITVLKDATSIYGVKGANGAIIITTTRAKQQATKIDVGMYAGINQAPDYMPVMNAYHYRTYLGEILQSKGMSSTDIAALPYMRDDTSGSEYYRYHNQTNWQKKIFNESMNRTIFLKVTGGDNIATYGLSVGYMKNEGIIKNTDITRYDTRFNAAFNFSKRFTGGANLSFTYNEQNLKDQGIADKTDPVFLSLTKAPFLTDHEVNNKGVFSPNFEDTDVFGVSNPTAVIGLMQANNKYYRFQGSFRFQYDITKTFKAATQFGIVYDKVRENVFIPRKGVADDTLSNAIADSRLGSQVKNLFTLFTDTYIEYNRIIKGKHSISSRLGLRYQHNDAEQDFALGFNSATDELVSVQNGVNALRQIGGGIGEWNWMNIYYNFDYNLKNKYFASVNVAMDASSRFGKQAENGITSNEVPFAIMPSVSFAWLMSSENFMAQSKIDLWKFRLSYGLSGNDDIGNYTSRQTYGSQNLLGMQGLVRNGIPNPKLQWETVQKLNAGMDIALFNERFGLSVDVFRSETTDMLVYEQLMAATGFDNIITNNGGMQNTGWEVSTNYRLLNHADLKWDIGFNIGQYKNKVVAVPGGSFTTEYAGATILTQNGNPANLFYGYKSLGVFTTSPDANAAGLTKKNADGSFTSFTAGDIRFQDLNGDKIIDENDRQVIGDPNPELFGGVNTRANWKRFELNAVITFSSGNDVFNYQRYRLESASSTNNQLNSVINRWRTEGQVTDMPKATYNDPVGNSRFSSRWIEDGSYLRLRSLSILYNVPMKEKFIKSATIYAAATNLLTFTKYMGYDPEFNASPSVFAQGIDTGLSPLYRSFTIGLKIGL